MGSEQYFRSDLKDLVKRPTVHESGLLLITLWYKCKSTQSSHVDPSQPKSTQSFQVDSIDPSQPESTHVNPSRPKSTQVDPSQPESTQVNPSRPKSTQVTQVIKAIQDVDGRTDDGQRPILKPHLSNQAKSMTSRSCNENCLPLPPGGHDNKTAPHTGGHVFQRTGTTFELDQHIIKTNILKNFELDRGIIGKNLLTKFHEDRTRNVASTVFTNQMWTDGRTMDKDRS
ncbi:hypothetical protein DPMN_042192 [Dreissena polymorpha]|uniref:Uncharacterized protein n=1 Tax=Dreissena polymorpha TaxID=45954 RepID=A0A9D4D049_DREPO|nr:hypothetical protein DPMN_042192 [Dreissena polymorpha]